MTEPLYPVFLKLAGVPVVIVGEGGVAASKRDGLLAAGANVTVVAPAEFHPDHLAGARWVVAAATPAVNRAVAAAAAERGLFVNAVDDPEVATAFLPAVIRRGDVEIAISTGGVAPALAALLREALAAVLPEDLERWIEVAKAARAEWKRDGTPIGDRKPLLLRALDGLYALDILRP